MVVLPPPYRQGYVYQGIKPAVLPVGDKATEELVREHVRRKQLDLVDRLKANKRHQNYIEEEGLPEGREEAVGREVDAEFREVREEEVIRVEEVDQEDDI